MEEMEGRPRDSCPFGGSACPYFLETKQPVNLSPELIRANIAIGDKKLAQGKPTLT